MSAIPAIISNDELERISVDTEKLLLDRNNPRLKGDNIDEAFLAEYESHDPRLQEHLRQIIYSKYNVQDLVASIKEVGFLKLDPVIVVEEPNGFYRVVEGNRRVTAIKTIHGEIKRRISTVTDSVLESITTTEVVKLSSEQDESSIWLLQGIRHVSGVRDWGPFQQAELVKALYEDKKLIFKQIGAIIGLSPQRVSTILKAYYGVSQMMQSSDWSHVASPKLFSHFEQAYVRAAVRDWLGWDASLQRYTSSENLNLFYRWITDKSYSNGKERVSSRDIRDRLPAILENLEAKNLFLTSSVSVEEAYRVATTGENLKKEILVNTQRLRSCLVEVDQAVKLADSEKLELQKLAHAILELI